MIDYKGAQLVESVRIGAVRDRLMTEVVKKYVKVKGATQVVTDTIVQEVVKHAQSNPAGVCLDAEWRSLHDGAALRPFPSAPPDLLTACERPQALQGSEAPTAAQALQTVTGNYARHHRCADRLDGLQDWVRGQAAVN